MAKAKTKTMDITVGADPEFFLKHNGKFVSAHDLVPGTKDKPFPLKNGVSVQADGTAVEFNIAPASTAKEFSDSITDALTQIRAMIDPKYEFAFTPAARYDKSYFDSLPDFSKELGCAPSFAAGSGGRRVWMNTAYADMYPTTRVAGGHIHVGWGNVEDPFDPAHLYDCCELVKSLDSFLSTVRYLWDKDEVRRNFYHDIGSFRPKTYGVEYRALSTAWLAHPKLYPWLFNMIKGLFDLRLRGKMTAGFYYNRYDRPDERLAKLNRELLRSGLPSFPMTEVEIR